MSTAPGDDYIAIDPAVLVVTDDTSVRTVERAPRFQWPFLLVSVIVVSALGLVAAGFLREGMAGMVLALTLAAALRLVLPGRTAGLLSSRSRVADTCCLGVAALGLAGTLLLLY